MLGLALIALAKGSLNSLNNKGVRGHHCPQPLCSIGVVMLTPGVGVLITLILLEHKTDVSFGSEVLSSGWNISFLQKIKIKKTLTMWRNTPCAEPFDKLQ